MSLFQQQHCTSHTTTRSQPWPIRLEFEVGRGGDATQILKLSCTYIVHSYMYYIQVKISPRAVKCKHARHFKDL